jgi:hypothetical protein
MYNRTRQIRGDEMFDRQFFEGKLVPAVRDFASKHCRKNAAPGVEIVLRDGGTYYVKRVVQAGEWLLTLLVHREKATSQIIIPYGEIARLTFTEKAPEPEAAFELP